MFTLKVTKADPTKLDQLIDMLETQLLTLSAETQEFSAVTDQLSKLHKLKEAQASAKRVSPDTWAMIGGNLLGIGVIVAYEHLHVVTSKALGFVLKSAR